MSIHNYERRFNRTLQRIKESSEISESNKKMILGFKDYLLSEGIGIAKIERYLGEMFKFNRFLGKPFEQANNIVVEKVRKDPVLKPLQCPRCKTLNPATNRFCNSCGFVLDADSAKEILIKNRSRKLQITS